MVRVIIIPSLSLISNSDRPPAILAVVISRLASTPMVSTASLVKPCAGDQNGKFGGLEGVSKLRGRLGGDSRGTTENEEYENWKWEVETRDDHDTDSHFRCDTDLKWDEETRVCGS